VNTQAVTKRRNKRGLIGALAALVLVGLALTFAALWALDRPRGLQVSPSSIHFGQQVVGQPGGAQTVTVTNRGGQPTIRSIRIEGEYADDFTVADASTCVDGPFPANASCTIAVRFTPTGRGDRAAVLFVAGLSGGPGVSLSGTGRVS
jgi:predicted membrane metal-binding protein